MRFNQTRLQVEVDNKSFQQGLIEGTTFDTCHREHQRVLTLVLLMRVELRQIESGKTGIEVKVQLQDIASLTIPQSRKLLGIAEEKLSLAATTPR